MAISFDSDVNDRVISVLNGTVDILNSKIRNKILTDYDSFIQINLFSTQLNSLKQSLDYMNKLYESLNKAIQDNKNQWVEVDNQAGSAIAHLNTGVGSINHSGNGFVNSSYSSSGNMSSTNSGVKISNSDVKSLIINLNDTTVIALLKRLYKLKGENDIMDLLTENSSSNVLTHLLKKILGDTSSTLDPNVTLEDSEIQKELLKKVNVNNFDITTEEGKTSLEKQVLENINNSSIDESALNEATYGFNTINVTLLDGSWVIAKTNFDLMEYASYVFNNGVRQNIDTSKYGDSCLAFAHSHAYDLLMGSRTNTVQAANYAHSSSFVDFIDDNKSTVLSKIYSEIMNGRPVVLQVNGNKQGTSRHFVTVVGFRNGITSPENLTEKDLLIIDSWDGKIERMDTATSRFMTSGADCHKDYSGYRLRVFKDNVTA